MPRSWYACFLSAKAQAVLGAVLGGRRAGVDRVREHAIELLRPAREPAVAGARQGGHPLADVLEGCGSLNGVLRHTLYARRLSELRGVMHAATRLRRLISLLQTVI